MDAHQPESLRLRRDVEWALRRALDPTDVLPLLHRLARAAPEGSDESVFAHRHLAEVLVERHPWRATLHARKALAARSEDDRAWAVHALCQTLLGNYRCAVSSYRRALACSPKNPWYAHNLGHLLDVALGKSEEAVGWLRTAYTTASDNSEIAASFAHALARAGQLVEAKTVLVSAMKPVASREHLALWKWLERGAPPEKDAPRPRPPPIATAALPARPMQDRPAPDAVSGPLDGPLDGPPTGDVVGEVAGEVAGELRASSRHLQRKHRPAATALTAALARGLENLPLDAKQRTRARALGRDAILAASTLSGTLSGTTGSTTATDLAGLAGLAAAVAYAIVYVDHVPLTQGEVAACFRVSAAALRGRFKQLRASLDLMPGDARYATIRH